MKQKTAVFTTVKQIKQKDLAELAVFPQPEHQCKLEFLYVNHKPGQLYKDHVVIIIFIIYFLSYGWSSFMSNKRVWSSGYYISTI